MAKSKNAHSGYRDSKTGRFVTADVARRRPATTQKEAIPNPGRGDTGRGKGKTGSGTNRGVVISYSGKWTIKPDSFTEKQGRAAVRSVMSKRLGVTV